MIPPADTAPPEPTAPTEMDNGVDLAALLDALVTLDCNASDAVLIDRISALERLKSAAAAAQARLTATFTDSRTADAKARHQQMDAAQRSITGQIGLARRDSPHTGRRHVGVAAALVTDLPHTLAALTRGDLSERRARIIVEQLACLTPADRREADRILAPELPHLGDRSAQTRAAAIACRLDPEAVMAKVRGAVKDRHVGLRPAPDTMSRLSALLPVHLGVAVYAALCTAADSATATPGGDPRSRGQLMADALVSAVTGKHVIGCDPYGVPQYGPAAADTTAPDAASATNSPVSTTTDRGPAAATTTDCGPAAASDATTGHGQSDVPAGSTNTADAKTADCTVADDTDFPGQAPAPISTAATSSTAPASAAVSIRGCTGGCGISINLTMTDRTLLDCDDEPAHLTGFGPIPAALARALVIGAADTTTRTWIRRLYTDPITGQPTAMDSKRRLFPPAAQRFLLARDQTWMHPGVRSTISTVRRPHPRIRPPATFRRRRSHEHRQRPRYLQSVQPHQDRTRVDHPLRPTRRNLPGNHRHHSNPGNRRNRRRRHPPHRTHRPHLPKPHPTTTPIRTLGRHLPHRTPTRQSPALVGVGPAASGQLPDAWPTRPSERMLLRNLVSGCGSR